MKNPYFRLRSWVRPYTRFESEPIADRDGNSSTPFNIELNDYNNEEEAMSGSRSQEEDAAAAGFENTESQSATSRKVTEAFISGFGEVYKPLVADIEDRTTTQPPEPRAEDEAQSVLFPVSRAEIRDKFQRSRFRFSNMRPRKQTIWNAVFLLSTVLITVAVVLVLDRIAFKDSTPISLSPDKQIASKVNSSFERFRYETVPYKNSHNKYTSAELNYVIGQPEPLMQSKVGEFPIPDDQMRHDREFIDAVEGLKTVDIERSENATHFLENIQNRKRANTSLVNEGMKFGSMQLRQLSRIELKLKDAGLFGVPRSPEYFHSLFKKSNHHERHMGWIGYEMTETARWIVKRLNMTKDEAKDGISSPDLSVPNAWCSFRSRIGTNANPCNAASPYRTLDGTCNNLKNPTWGSAFQMYRRILVPDYADGLTVPRVSSNGSPLPNARHVSQTLANGNANNESQATMMMPLWAQMISYDLSNTIQSSAKNNSQISCCANGTLLEIQHPECFPIYAGPESVFSKKVDDNHRCITMIRSAPAPTCDLGPREQFSECTSYLDGSNIYGSSEKSNLLRSFKSGQLQVYSRLHGKSFLAIDDKDDCLTFNNVRQKHSCFKSGDRRTNANLGFVSMQTLWTRHHNNIAKILSSLNALWEDNRVFEETRRIVIAQIQHITYNEFLPLLLGPDLITRANLKLKETGYYSEYDENIDATLDNVFATVANRYGHSMIQDVIRLRVKNLTAEVPIHRYFFNPLSLRESGRLDDIIKSHAELPARRVDTVFSKEIIEHLFQGGNYTFGLDMMAINIQRGRDHGIPAYTRWRSVCKLPNISSFKDLENIWQPDSVKNVQLVYKSVHDIDLFVGGLAEKHVQNGLVGPTFGCLIADQFARARQGDRFWYEGDVGNKFPFLPDQLKNIRKITLAHILCENGDDLQTIQPNAFRRQTAGNEVSLCDGDLIPKVDYAPWRDYSNDQYANGDDHGEPTITPFNLEQDEMLNEVESTGESDLQNTRITQIMK